MNTKSLALIAMVVAIGAVCFDSANAFYAPHLGRFVNQDPAGQRPGIGMGQSFSGSGFLERDNYEVGRTGVGATNAGVPAGVFICSSKDLI